MSDATPWRILLSPPDVGEAERRLLLEAFDSNWIAPVGPHVDAFEGELADRLGIGHAVALSSGTAALHLALREAGVGSGDRVLCPTMTFVASANAIRYLGAEPVFVDAHPDSWNLDVALVREELRASTGRRPYAAVMAVDLYGRCCEYEALLPLCLEHGIPVVEDAAEALGATYRGSPAGTFGRFGAFSFNGNKIITTSGGGMLVTDDGAAADRIRHLATQAREPAPHYEHRVAGFNYRLSNLLAALGLAQLRTLDVKVARRRGIKARYRELLGGLPGVEVAPDGHAGEPNAWLTCITIDPDRAGATREDVRRRLVSRGIEARPVWKPMHLQPLFRGWRCIGGQVAERLFAHGLCLPSGSSLSEGEQDEICAVVHDTITPLTAGPLRRKRTAVGVPDASPTDIASCDRPDRTVGPITTGETVSDDVQVASDVSRRDFVKRGAIIGGLVWTAPVIQSIGAPAFAFTPEPGEGAISYVAFVVNCDDTLFRVKFELDGWGWDPDPGQTPHCQPPADWDTAQKADGGALGIQVSGSTARVCFTLPDGCVFANDGTAMGARGDSHPQGKGFCAGPDAGATATQACFSDPTL